MADHLFKCLEAVLDAGSVALASRRLFVSQPALSQYIRRVERDYGVTVFDRSASPWTLTAEGERLLETRRQMAALDESCRQFFADRRGLRTGTIRIGSTAYRTATLLNPVLAVFRRRYPGITVKIEEGTTREAAELADSGRADCAFVITAMVPASLDSVPVFRERVLVALPGEIASRLPPGAASGEDDGYPVIDFKAIAGTPFIVMKRGQIFHDYFERLGAELGADLPVILETQSILTVPALISAGLGGALVPSTIADECRAKGIALFSPGPLLPVNEVSLAWRRGRYQSCAAARFIETAQEVLSGRPGGVPSRKGEKGSGAPQ